MTASLRNNPDLPPPLPRMIEDGYGDWIVRNKTGKEVELDTYRKVAAIFKDHHPLKWKNNQDRIQSLKTKVYQINPEFELTFIPRSLYELTFLRQAIEEDIDRCSKLFRDQNHLPREELWRIANEQCQKSNNSWCSPVDTVALAHRLNGIFNRMIAKSPCGPLEHAQLKAFLEDQISFLRHIYCNPDFAKLIIPWQPHIAPPAAHFIYDTGRTRSIALGISDEGVANVIRNSFELECSSPGKVILFRGTDGDFYSPHHSHSYGTSLFAGYINDPTACAFWYMRKLGSIAILLSTQDFPFELIYSPVHSSTIEQLLDSNEFFHRRVKLCKQPLDHPITGIMGKEIYSKVPNSLKSNLNSQELEKLYDQHIKHPINLRSKL